MPFVPFSRTDLSDLVYHENDPSVGYSRSDINVTPPSGGAAVKMGTVVFRAKAKANTAATAYAVLSSDAQLDSANEFAIVFGDHYGCNESFVPRSISSGQFNAVAFVGKNGAIMLKDTLIREFAQDTGGLNLSDGEFENLRELLAEQGLRVEATL